MLVPVETRDSLAPRYALPLPGGWGNVRRPDRAPVLTWGMAHLPKAGPHHLQSMLTTHVSHWTFVTDSLSPLFQGDPGRPGFSYPGPRGTPVSPGMGWREGQALSWETGQGVRGFTCWVQTQVP